MQRILDAWVDGKGQSPKKHEEDSGAEEADWRLFFATEQSVCGKSDEDVIVGFVEKQPEQKRQNSHASQDFLVNRCSILLSIARHRSVRGGVASAGRSTRRG
jgi:hypothetical protein